MKQDEIARWAAKFAKKGVRAAIANSPPPQPATPPPPSWGPPAGANPYRGQPWGGRPMELETLVRPGPSAYESFMANVPELYPDNGDGDSMSGPLSRENELARREALMGVGSDPGVRPGDERDAIPRGYRGMPMSGQPAPLVQLSRAPAAADQMLDPSAKPN